MDDILPKPKRSCTVESIWKRNQRFRKFVPFISSQLIRL